MPRLRRWNEAEQARRGGKVEGTASRLLPGICDVLRLRRGGQAGGQQCLRYMRREERARHAVPLHGRERRAELACGEVFQGAEASVEFGGRQAPLAVESAQKIRGWTVALAGIAFE